MLGKYTRIEKVTYKDNFVGYLLTGDDVSNGFEVDMNSDFWFDGIGIKLRQVEKQVSSLEEVIAFCKEQDIDISDKRFNGTTLFIGGETDMAINENLEFDWVLEEENEMKSCIELE